MQKAQWFFDTVSCTLTVEPRGNIRPYAQAGRSQGSRMGIFSDLTQRIRNKYERGANYELGHSLSSSAVSTLFGKGGDKINVLEEYAGIAWKCIDIRAERLSAEDLFVERLVAKKWQANPAHDFNAILEGGDGENDQSELLEAHEKSMSLFGESFWYFSKGESSQKPFAIYLLNPNSVTVMISGQKVTGYVWQEEGNRVAFDVDEIAHFKIHDWRHPFRGTGPMQSAGWFIRSSRYTMTYVNNFMENNAIPAGVIVAEGGVSDDDWKLFKSEWAAKYGGIDNAGKTGFLRNSKVNFVKTGLSLGEVDFDKVKESDMKSIMVMFGISKPMMAIFDDINRASAVTARRLFAEAVTEPALMKLKRKLTKKVKKWYGPDYQIESTNPVPEDDEIKMLRLEKGTNRWMTVNEARIADGLEPLGTEYDVIIPENRIPERTPAKSIGKITIRTKNNKADFSYEMKESFRSETEDIQLKYEQQYLQVTNKLLTEQKKRVLSQIGTKQKLIAADFDPEEEARKMTEEALPLFILLAEEQGKLAAGFVGNAGSEFKLTPVLETYIRESIGKSHSSFNVETRELIAKAVQEGLERGDSMTDIAHAISGIYKDVLGVKTPGFRTERLVRTEVIKTSNEITEAAYRQSGLVRKKEWFANPGRCEFCAALNGSIVQLGSPFVSLGGQIEGVDGGTRINAYEDVRHPPVHPQCRCTLIPVIEEAD